MSLKPRDPLLTAGRILVLIMQVLVAVIAAFMLLLILVILLGESAITAELAANNPGTEFAFPTAAIVFVLALAAAALALLFLFFRKLRQIIATVGEGDPFVPENAQRLSQMAWLTLGANLISVPIGLLGLHVADEMGGITSEDFDFDVGLDGGGILLIIVLFILARVFRKGTEMRDDLEGTV